MSEVAPSVLDRLRSLLASRYIDDGTDQTPDRINLIPNGTFEHDVTGQPVMGWEKLTGSTNMISIVVNYAPQSHGGKGTAVGSGAAEVWRYRTTEFLPVEPGTSYTLTFGNYQISSNATGFRSQIEWYDEDEVLLSTASAPNTTNGGNGVLSMRSQVAVSPAGAAFAKVCLDHNVADIANFYVDAFMFCPTALHPGLTTASANYADGDTVGAEWFWKGTVGNSISQTPRFPPSSDDILEAILGGIADGAERFGVVAFGDANVPVGRALSDPSVAPDWALPHAALYTSGGLLPGQKAGEAAATYLARARDAAVYPLGIKAGTNEAIVRTVQPLLTGTKTVFITVGSDPYTVVVRTLPAETPDQAAVAAAITGSFVSGGLRGALRAELALDYTVSNSPQFSEATRAYSAVAGTVTATNVTRTDVT